MSRPRAPLDGLRVNGPRLRELRIRARLTQKALAELAGTTEQWLRRIESHDQQPSRPIAEDLADGLGVPLTAFCDPTDSPTGARA